MTLKKQVFIAILFISSFLKGYSQTLSNEAKISLLTISPGEELYSAFGHSAFWVYDPIQGYDRVYNYGTFDFNEPNFYTKFIRGKLLYKLSVGDLYSIVEGAKYENRGVIEQELNLSKEIKNKLFQFLETNNLPQNRYYKYDFFFDNCSTRLRDALGVAADKSLTFNLKETEKKSFRQLLDPFLVNKQWQDMGMDIGLGTPADQIARPYDYMYLPEHLYSGFASATILTTEEKTNDTLSVKKGVLPQKALPLVKATRVIFKQTERSIAESSFSPTMAFWLLFLIVLIFTVFQLKSPSPSYLVDVVFLTITGLLGFLIVFLWLGTDHKVTANNWNLIWAMPLNVIAAFLLPRRKALPVLRLYFLIYGILMLLLVTLWPFLPQELNIATLPFILILVHRSFFIFFKLNTGGKVRSNTI